MTTVRDRLREELHDAEYRHEYASEFLDMIVARQIRALRKERGWTQSDLAAKLQKKQSYISAIESEEYGALSLSTLKELARAFDVRLEVRFASFEGLLDDVERSSMEELQVPPFSEDDRFASAATGEGIRPSRR